MWGMFSHVPMSTRRSRYKFKTFSVFSRDVPLKGLNSGLKPLSVFCFTELNLDDPCVDNIKKKKTFFFSIHDTKVSLLKSTVRIKTLVLIDMKKTLVFI
jgi:hypothetical protein